MIVFVKTAIGLKVNEKICHGFSNLVPQFMISVSRLKAVHYKCVRLFLVILSCEYEWGCFVCHPCEFEVSSEGFPSARTEADELSRDQGIF